MPRASSRASCKDAGVEVAGCGAATVAIAATTATQLAQARPTCALPMSGQSDFIGGAAAVPTDAEAQSKAAADEAAG